MNGLLVVLQTVGRFSAVVAIACMLIYIRLEFAGLATGEQETQGTGDNYFWAGFALLGVWMACEIGMIGL